MKEIGVSLSKKQWEKLHKGLKVRVKQGEGIMLVHPERYDVMSKTFLRGKAQELSLTPEEILANKQTSPEAHQETQADNEAKTEVSLEPVKEIKGAGFVSNAGGSRSLGGHKHSYLMKAGLGNEEANHKTTHYISVGLETARQNKIMPVDEVKSKRTSREVSSIGVGGNLLPVTMRSDPRGTNFQFSKTLPPSFQKFTG